jgi:hypothetical protein
MFSYWRFLAHFDDELAPSGDTLALFDDSLALFGANPGVGLSPC